MGPLPVGSGRPAGPASARCPDRCFNGAAPGRERKTHSPARIRMARSELQWGRSRSGAEDPGSRRSRYGLAAASMGPLPVGSGRRLLTTAEPEEDAASMGPLPVGSGRRTFLRAHPARRAASMGPLPVGSGRRGTPAPSPPASCRFNGAAPGRERKTRAARLTHRRPPSCFNGAAPGRERKTGPSRPWNRRPCSCFNGAAPGRERKTTGRRRPSVSRRPSFNGAAPGRERKTKKYDANVQAQQQLQWGRSRSGAEDHASRRHGAAPSPLQWGRSRSGAEDTREEVRRLLDEMASMGPLPVGSGRRRITRKKGSDQPCFNGAAPGRERKTRGPRRQGRLIGRFNGAAPGRERKTCEHTMGPPPDTVASMGPLPVGSGRPSELLQALRSEIALQWGRSRSGAEDHAGLGVCVLRAELQWGRSRSGAEDSRHAGRPGRMAGCFNGAAPGRERKTPPDLGSHLALAAASMGPLPVGSGRPGSTFRSSSWCCRFNGAAPGRERKTRQPAQYPESVQGFNGAAPGRERKTLWIVIPAAAGMLLQWGRSRSGAEDGRPLGPLQCNRLRGLPREVVSGGWSDRVGPDGPATESLSTQWPTTRERRPWRDSVPSTGLPKNLRARAGRTAVSSPHRSRGFLRQESIAWTRS